MPALAWRLALACTLLRVGADAQNTCSVCESETTGAAEGVYWPPAARLTVLPHTLGPRSHAFCHAYGHTQLPAETACTLPAPLAGEASTAMGGGRASGEFPPARARAEPAHCGTHWQPIRIARAVRAHTPATGSGLSPTAAPAAPTCAQDRSRSRLASRRRRAAATPRLWARAPAPTAIGLRRLDFRRAAAVHKPTSAAVSPRSAMSAPRTAPRSPPAAAPPRPHSSSW